MRKTVVFFTLLGIVLSGCTQPSIYDSKAPIKSTLLPMYSAQKRIKPEFDVVEAMLKTMTLEEKVGQLVIAGFYGTKIDAVTERIARDAKVGGFIFYQRNIETTEQTVSLLNDFKSLSSRIPLFLSVDEEGGSASRLPDEIMNLPDARSFEARKNLNITYDLGLAVGYVLNQYGFNLNYAPVLDIVGNTTTSAIGARSFSSDPAMVSEMGMLMVRGMENEHVISVVKHFPGIGNTPIDTHTELPVLTSSLQQLTQSELVPFTYAIERNVSAIMVGHVVVAAVDANLPASLSYPVMTGLLRESMRFEGVIVTDDLGMGAISTKNSQAQAAIMSIMAGADIVMVSHGVEEPFNVVAALKQAVLDSRISEKRIDESVRRILKLKLSFKLDNILHPNVNINEMNAKFNALLK